VLRPIVLICRLGTAQLASLELPFLIFSANSIPLIVTTAWSNIGWIVPSLAAEVPHISFIPRTARWDAA
jgi:hypothetical protein